MLALAGHPPVRENNVNAELCPRPAMFLVLAHVTNSQVLDFQADHMSYTEVMRIQEFRVVKYEKFDFNLFVYS